MHNSLIQTLNSIVDLEAGEIEFLKTAFIA